MEQTPKRRMRLAEKGILFFILAGGLVGVMYMFYLNANVDEWNVKLETEKAPSQVRE